MAHHTDGSDGAADGRDAETEPSSDRWLADALDADLPGDVRAALGGVLGGASVETLGDWIAEVRRLTGGGSIAVDDLCRVDGETGHRGEMDGETYHFRCFYDAVVLSALADRPVDIRTESPEGTVIEMRAAGTDDLTVAPDGAVFSFGVDETAVSADGDPLHADIYAAVCPYVKAFPNPDAYERWAETVSAATVAMPLAGATDVAAALVE